MDLGHKYPIFLLLFRENLLYSCFISDSIPTRFVVPQEKQSPFEGFDRFDRDEGFDRDEEPNESGNESESDNELSC